MAKEKPQTAVDGAAPGGPDFTDANKPLASSQDAKFGDGVRPETQTREDDPRFLAKPVTDPGPDFEAHGHAGWRNPGKGETLNGVNEDVRVTRRVSTAPDYFTREGSNVDSGHTLGAHVVGAETLASKVYHPRQGEGLTDVAMEKSGEEREVSPGASAPPNATEGTTV